MIEVTPLKLEGSCLVKFGKRYDTRGWFNKIFNSEIFTQSEIGFEIKEVYASSSSYGVIRGMHYQAPPYDHAKLVSVLSGKLFDVIVDLRLSSETYGKCQSIQLDAKSGVTLFIPAGIAHGFCAMEDNTITQYCVSSVYDTESDGGILWSSIDVDWPIAHPIISERDAKLPHFSNFETPFL